MRETVYDRQNAAAYASRWATDRNPAYYDFSTLGGDCTSFVSQCLYAGCGIMNYPGWYYRSSYDRAPAWTGVNELYSFVVSNRGAGPWAEETEPEVLEPGDIIQLRNPDGRWYHTLLVVETAPHIYIAAHTFDAYMRPLLSYDFAEARYLHIAGVRKW